MHPNNPYSNNPPDFISLGNDYPTFRKFLQYPKGDQYATIDFQDPAALRELTKTLLKYDFDLDVELPEDRLCPTLANRLDYILCVLDVALTHLTGSFKQGDGLRVLDIGTGAIAIYAILLARLKPNAQICATEIEPSSFAHARKTILVNELSNVDVRLANEHEAILQPLYVLDDNDSPYTFTLCNPPFYESTDEMNAGTAKKSTPPPAAATAATNELITRGGEIGFVGQMMVESVDVKNRCGWFTSLIGKTSSIPTLVKKLRTLQINNYFIMDIRQAETRRWIIGWSFTGIRIPDMQIKAYDYPASIQCCLPPSNTFHCGPSDGAPTLKNLVDVVERVFTEDLQLNLNKEGMKDILSKEGTNFTFRPRHNIWGRHARRKAQQGKLLPVQPSIDSVPLFEVRIMIQQNPRSDQEEGAVDMIWIWGHDREIVAGFSWFMERKISEACKAIGGGERAHKRIKVDEGVLG